ncbi:unnamed protein product [Peniophora sp. CBMAI 1063]|nr:unnamed protein product [Peniophora sp. CBMAI 1063]
MNAKIRKICRESHKWRGIREHPSHAARKAAEREYRRAIYVAKKTHWEEWLEDVGEDDIWTANKFAKAGATDGGAASIPTLKRTVTPGVEEAAATNADKSAFLAASFFPAPPEDAAIPANTVYPQPIAADASISESTVLRHLARLSPYKAPGPDGIQNVVLTKCADILAPWLVVVYNAILRHGYYYAGWKEFLTIVLRKPDKPDYAVSKAYRPIALLCTMAKVLTAIVTEQLTYLSEQHGLLPSAQYGGRPGRTTTDSMHVLNDIITAAWAEGKVASVLFLDIEGAFPNAVPEVLIHDLRMCRVPAYIVNFVQLLLEGRSTQLKFDGYESAAFPVLNGIPQGDPMSLILYLFYGADLLRVPRGSKEKVAGFVDDSALVAIGDTFDETHATLQDMFERRGGAREWATKHFSRFETSKFKLMDFSRSPIQRPELRLGNVTIRPTHTHRFLGVIWDDQLKWKDQADGAVAKGRKYVLAIRRLARIKHGLRPKFVRRLYISVAIPKMLYAVDVWCLPIPRDIPCARPTMSARQGSLGVIRRLATVQRIAALTITGGLRSSPNDILDIHANLLPMRLLVAKHCFRALTRISALPETHPLFPIAESSAAAFPSKFRSPLQHLYHLFPEVAPSRVEDIIPMRHDPAHADLAFTTFIADSREESQHDNDTLETVIRVYTDGSGYKGFAGAAALLIRTDGIHNMTRILRYCLGPLTQHTVYEAEAVGIILGAHLLATEEREFASEPSSISLDNQAVIRASKHQQRAQPGHGLLDVFRDQTDRLLQNRDENYSLSVRWVSGHDDAEFNEIIDEQAKLAAEGHASALVDLPYELRTCLKISISAARQEYARRLDERWHQDWLMSPRYERHRHWATDAASRKHMRATASLSRLASSTLFQIRSGHAPLSAHLYRIGCLPSPTCETCGEADETVHHYLYDCPRWQDARQRMREAAGKLWRERTRMLSDEKGIAAVLTYTRETGWGSRGEREKGDGRPETGLGEAREDEERDVGQEVEDERRVVDEE